MNVHVRIIDNFDSGQLDLMGNIHGWDPYQHHDPHHDADDQVCQSNEAWFLFLYP